MNQPSDEGEDASAAAAREGADDALLGRHGPAIWRAVVRLLGHDARDDAADCFQQAFVELATRRRRDPAAVRDAGALLMRIAIVRAIDCVRRRVRDRQRQAGVGRGGIELAASDEAEAGESAEAAELLADLRAALAELPPQQSAAFVLTQLEDLPYDAAAAAIGVSVNHLGVLLHRARSSLRGRLDSHRDDVREVRR